MKLEKLLYRIDETAQLLSAGKSTVYDLVRDGELRCHNRFPDRKGMRITADSIQKYIDRHLVDPDKFRE